MQNRGQCLAYIKYYVSTSKTSFCREKASAGSSLLFALPLTAAPAWAPSGGPALGAGEGALALAWRVHVLHHPQPPPSGWAPEPCRSPPGREVTATLTYSYLGAFPANWFTGFGFPPDWKARRKVTSPRSGPGLAESPLVAGESPHTLTSALGALLPGGPAREVQREKGLDQKPSQDIEPKNLSELQFSSTKGRSQRQLLLCG